mmetsp:Transcript_31510/g.80195  ORF Transcript_31510/g.80195 Transcript_31510/m.80195 type:complete len:236 (+) Transcript_31510:1949-2656(+)
MPPLHDRPHPLRRARRLHLHVWVQRHKRCRVRPLPRGGIQDVQRHWAVHPVRHRHLLDRLCRQQQRHVPDLPWGHEHLGCGAERVDRLQVQQGVHGARRRGVVHGVRRRQVEAHPGVAGLHGLPRGDLLDGHGADARVAVRRVPRQLLVRLGVQRAVRLLRDILHDTGGWAKHAPRGGDQHADGHARHKRRLCALQEHRHHHLGPLGGRGVGRRAPLGRVGGQLGGGALRGNCLL